MNNIRVCVTGATGFVGAHLVCLLLKKGYQVNALARSADKIAFFQRIHTYHDLPANLQPQWVYGDLSDTDSLIELSQNCSQFYHCAALVSFSSADREILYQTNVEGTHNVVNACLANNIKHLLYTSSVAALGRNEKQTTINEDAKWVDSKLNSNYAITKHKAELEVWRAKEEGIQIGIVNPGIILGYGDGHSSSNQIYQIAKKNLPFYPTGSNGFVGVEDVASLLIFIAENQLWDKRFICVSENLTYKHIFHLLSQEMGTKMPEKPLKKSWLSLLVAIAGLAEKLHLPFPIPSETLYSTAENSVYHTIYEKELQQFIYQPIRAVNHYALKALGLSTH